MDILFAEIAGGWPDARQSARMAVGLLSAMVFGAVIGAQRESKGKPAGLRTHTLVAMGGALFVLAPLELGMDLDGISRVIQGIVTGIGFLGAGAILKLHESRQIEGLTTAAGIWITAAAGIAAGLGRWGLALAATILAFIVLSVLARVEQWMESHE
jgi:putative Mg2+ transporter-C (MgtC) family protein